MTRRLGLVCVLLAVGAVAFGDAASRARRELSALRRARRRGMGRAGRVADRAVREVEAEHLRIARREVEIASEYRTEAALIYLDRERAAGRDPYELQRERDRQLAAERYRIDGLRYTTAADLRLGSETRRLRRLRGRYGTGRGGVYGGELERAEQWAIDGAVGAVFREQQRRQAIIRRVLAVAEQMEREAQAKEPRKPRARRRGWLRRWLLFF